LHQQRGDETEYENVLDEEGHEEADHDEAYDEEDYEEEGTVNG
jgi:hypothetical protein